MVVTNYLNTMFVCEKTVYSGWDVYCTVGERLFVTYDKRDQYSVFGKIQFPLVRVVLEKDKDFISLHYRVFSVDRIHDNCRMENDADKLIYRLENE